MVRSGLLAAVAAAALVVGAGQASASQLVSNGDFSTGLTGWSVNVVNPTYTVFQFAPTTATFATVAGVPSPAAELSVGTNHSSQPNQGGGLSQTITNSSSHAVWVKVSADFAAKALDASTDGGIVSIILDGSTLASYDFGAMAKNSTSRTSLWDTISLGTGAHALELQVTRSHSTSNFSPVTFFDNASALSGLVSAVPEPKGWAMILSGLFMLGAALRSRKLFGQVA